MRDFAKELSSVKCWDEKTESFFRTTGAPREDCILQTKAELIAFCEWMEQEKINSFLEIGVWTGRLVITLKRLFNFKHVAACDLGIAKLLGLPFHLPAARIPCFLGDSHSPEYETWRKAQGHFDVVMIDGDHSYEGVKRDFEINRRFSHRFLVFHDITGANHTTVGVKKFWDELKGNKLEILRPHSEIGWTTSSMGIGIWWK